MSGVTGKLPNYARIDGDGTVVPMAPQIVHHDGHNYLVAHAEGFTTGVAVSRGQAPREGRFVITTWCQPAPDAPLGLALTFTPNDAMLDTIIASLTRFRDEQRRHAVASATAALKKAAGK